MNILDHKFTSSIKKNNDRKTVPHVLQFATRKQGSRKPVYDEEHYVDMFHVVAFRRKYRKILSQEEEIKIIREARNLPDNVVIDIIFSGHPRNFFTVAARAYSTAYVRKKNSVMEKIQMILDVLSDYDPRNGKTWDEHDCQWLHR